MCSRITAIMMLGVFLAPSFVISDPRPDWFPELGRRFNSWKDIIVEETCKEDEKNMDLCDQCVNYRDNTCEANGMSSDPDGKVFLLIGDYLTDLQLFHVYQTQRFVSNSRKHSGE